MIKTDGPSLCLFLFILTLCERENPQCECNCNLERTSILARANSSQGSTKLLRCSTSSILSPTLKYSFIYSIIVHYPPCPI